MGDRADSRADSTGNRPHPAFWAGVAQARMAVEGTEIWMRKPKHDQGAALLWAFQANAGVGGRLVDHKGSLVLKFGNTAKDVLTEFVEPHRTGATDRLAWAKGYFIAKASVSKIKIVMQDTSPEVVAMVRAAMMEDMPDLVLGGSDTLIYVGRGLFRDLVTQRWLQVPAMAEVDMTIPLRDANARAEARCKARVNEIRRARGQRQKKGTVTSQTAIEEIRGLALAFRAKGMTIEPATLLTIVDKKHNERLTKSQVRYVLEKLKIPFHTRTHTLIPDYVKPRMMYDLGSNDPVVVQQHMRNALPEHMVPRLETLRYYKRRAKREGYGPTSVRNRPPTWTEIGARAWREFRRLQAGAEANAEANAEAGEKDESESATESGDSETESDTMSETGEGRETGERSETTGEGSETGERSETTGERSETTGEGSETTGERSETTGERSETTGEGSASVENVSESEGDDTATDAFWAGVLDGRGMQCENCLKVRVPQWEKGEALLRAMQWRYGGRLAIPAKGPVLLRFNGARQATLTTRLAPHRQGVTHPEAWARGYMVGAGAARGELKILTARVSSDQVRDLLAACPDVVVTADGTKATVPGPGGAAAWVPVVPVLSLDKANERADRLTLVADNARRRELGIRQMNARITPAVRAAIEAAHADPRLRGLTYGVIASHVTKLVNTHVTWNQVAYVFGKLGT